MLSLGEQIPIDEYDLIEYSTQALHIFSIHITCEYLLKLILLIALSICAIYISKPIQYDNHTCI